MGEGDVDPEGWRGAHVFARRQSTSYCTESSRTDTLQYASHNARDASSASNRTEEEKKRRMGTHLVNQSEKRVSGIRAERVDFSLGIMAGLDCVTARAKNGGRTSGILKLVYEMDYGDLGQARATPNF